MIPIHAVLLCATAAGWPCHGRAIHIDTVPRALIPIDTPMVSLDTPITRRPKAIQYSDWYARRLLVHRIGSYTMIPLFAAEWSLGQNLLQGQDPAGRTRRYLHTAAMLASDAGFIWAGAVGGDARRSRDNSNHHRAIALT